MDQELKKALFVGAAALAGGWGGVAAVNRIGAAYGLRLGTAGTLAGAAVGAYLGASVCRKLLARTGDIEGELELDMNVEDEAA